MEHKEGPIRYMLFSELSKDQQLVQAMAREEKALYMSLSSIIADWNQKLLSVEIK